MSTSKRIAELLDLDLDAEMWCCHRCGRKLISARENYKRGCLVYDRDPRTIYPPPPSGESTLTPDPAWCRLIEFYCPGCGAMLDVEVLPPGHPITHDIELDLDKLREKLTSGE